ncbi:hypothetical protein [Desulfobaculum sp.]
MIAEDAATRLADHRRDVQARLAAVPESWRTLLAQIITDVTGAPTQLPPEEPPTVNATVPYLAIGRYYFTPATRRIRQLKGLHAARPHTLPADAQVELWAVWDHLSAQLSPLPPALPRRAPWTLLEG